MITGSEEESRALMMNATIRVVADSGIGGFTTKKWAAEAGVAEGSLYYHFKSKSDLLDQTFLFVNEAMVANIDVVPDHELTDTEMCEFANQIWNDFYRYLLEHPDETRFFIRYRISPRYTEEVRKVLRERYTELMAKMRFISRYNEFSEDIDWDFFWGYISDATLSIANRVISGQLKHPENAEKSFINIIMNGIAGMFKGRS